MRCRRNARAAAARVARANSRRPLALSSSASSPRRRVVEIDELRLQFGQAFQALRLERFELAPYLRKLQPRRARGVFRLPRLLDAEVALDLQLANLADERARLAGQARGFALERTHAARKRVDRQEVRRGLGACPQDVCASGRDCYRRTHDPRCPAPEWHAASIGGCEWLA